MNIKEPFVSRKLAKVFEIMRPEFKPECLKLVKKAKDFSDLFVAIGSKDQTIYEFMRYRTLHERWGSENGDEIKRCTCDMCQNIRKDYIERVNRVQKTLKDKQTLKTALRKDIQLSKKTSEAFQK